MDFGETEEHQLMRKTISDLVKQIPERYWREIDQKGEFPRQLWDKLAETGWMGVNTPTEYGGTGLGHAECSIATHETSRSGAGCATNILLSPYLTSKAINNYGSNSIVYY